MKKKGIKIISIISVVVILAGYIVNYYSLKTLNKDSLDVDKFIKNVDIVSENKAQINWKYVASILASINKNDLGKISDSDIKDIAAKFINKSHKLNKLDEVICALNMSDSEEKRIYKYIEDLENHGLKPSRLNKDGEYIKFINKVKIGAVENYKKYKILPSITIAQAILESNWGKSSLTSKYNNVFGIKADKNWKGEYVTLETKEFNNTFINDKFRKYSDISESITDHGRFLVENKRYTANGVFKANTYINQANALQKAGYSTATNDKGEKVYASMIITIIQQYNLQVLDSETQSSM